MLEIVGFSEDHYTFGARDMPRLLTTVRSQWRQLIGVWLFPFFLVFIYIPLEKTFPNYRWSLWFFLAAPVFFASFGFAFSLWRKGSLPRYHGMVLIGVAPLLLVLVALAFRDAILHIFR